MKKDRLMELGVDETLAATIETELTEEMKGYVPKARFDEVNAQKKQAEDSVKTYKEQLDTLKASEGASEALKQQVADLQRQNAEAEQAHKQELDRIRLDSAVDIALTNAKALNNKAARALLDLEGAKIDKDGNVIGLAEQIKALSEAEDTKFLFGGAAPRLKGAKLGEGADRGEHGADLSKMSYAELSAYFEANPDAVQ